MADMLRPRPEYILFVRIHLMEVDELPDNSPNAEVEEYEDWGVGLRDLAPPKGLRRWIIFDESTIVGNMSAHPVSYGPNEGSVSMNIGISVRREFRGLGIGSAAQKILAEILHSAGYVRIEAGTDVGNLAEQKALSKAGFQFEGILRAAQVRRSGRHDLQLWSHVSPEN